MSAKLFIKTQPLDTFDIPQILAWMSQQTCTPSFIWENPSQDHFIAACGSIISNSQRADFSDLNKLIQQVKYRLDNWSLEEAAHLKVVGGLPFFKSDMRPNHWQNLRNGRLWIPQIIIEHLSKHTYLTIIQDNYNQLQQQLRQISQQLITIAPLKAQKYSLTNFQELALKNYQSSGELALDKIKQQKINKIVLGRFATAKISYYQAEALWLQLKNSQPHVYHILIKDHDTALLSATPERLLTSKHGHFYTAAVAGTCTRGKTPAQDLRLQQQLLHDDKNRQEQALVVDWIKQSLLDLQLQVSAPLKPQIIQTATVQHLYTPIKATGSQKVAKILEKLHPTPALGGLPRAEALSFIQHQESESRGMFGAPLGYLNALDEGEFAIGIRSCLLLPQQIRLFAGSGLINGSNISTETQETYQKFQAILSAFKLN